MLGMLAVEILAVGNKDLREKLLEFRKEMKEDFKKKYTCRIITKMNIFI